jgi:antitoxin PrlF
MNVEMVLPKEIREKANIQAGDKLALVSWEQMNEVSCINLIKIEDLNKMVQEMLEPVLK